MQFEALARTPGTGHKREELTSYPVLFWVLGDYLIIYYAGRSPIEVVAVTHSSRDITPFLAKRMRP